MSTIWPCKVTISPDVLCQEIGGETVLLDLRSEAYFGLDVTGTRIWQLLQETESSEKVVDAMLKEYDITREHLEKDLFELLQQMSEIGLVSLEDAM